MVPTHFWDSTYHGSIEESAVHIIATGNQVSCLPLKVVGRMTECNCFTEPIVQLSNISKTFGKIKALDSVSLTVNRNEIFGLLGPNGSGKTTLLRILATLIRPDSIGSRTTQKAICKVAGYDLFTQGDNVRPIIGYVPQRDSLYTDISTEDNLVFFSAPYTIDGRQERIAELLRMAGLYDRRNDLVGILSGGMLKRLSIICALAHEPLLMIFDEATIGLDAQTRRGIWHLIKELKEGKAIIVTTHLINEAEEYCDRVALLFKGRVLAFGTPAALVAKNPPAQNLEEAARIIQEAHSYTGDV